MLLTILNYFETKSSIVALCYAWLLLSVSSRILSAHSHVVSMVTFPTTTRGHRSKAPKRIGTVQISVRLPLEVGAWPISKYRVLAFPGSFLLHHPH